MDKNSFQVTICKDNSQTLSLKKEHYSAPQILLLSVNNIIQGGLNSVNESLDSNNFGS